MSLKLSKWVWYDETKYCCKWVKRGERKALKREKRKASRLKNKKEIKND
jgi:hypothetical protein